MKRYEMNKQKEGSITYFFIRDTETWDIVLLPTKYLMHMTKAKCSPNTVRRSGCSILYYLEYLFLPANTIPAAKINATMQNTIGDSSPV